MSYRQFLVEIDLLAQEAAAFSVKARAESPLELPDNILDASELIKAYPVKGAHVFTDKAQTLANRHGMEPFGAGFIFASLCSKHVAALEAETAELNAPELIPPDKFEQEFRAKAAQQLDQFPEAFIFTEQREPGSTEPVKPGVVTVTRLAACEHHQEMVELALDPSCIYFRQGRPAVSWTPEGARRVAKSLRRNAE